MPQMVAGDMQGVMNKLHTEEKAPAPLKEPAKPAPEKKGLLSGLFGKK
jgi:hypothetical protein